MKPPCLICKKDLSKIEFKGKRFIINVCGNCEYNPKNKKKRWNEMKGNLILNWELKRLFKYQDSLEKWIKKDKRRLKQYNTRLKEINRRIKWKMEDIENAERNP